MKNPLFLDDDLYSDRVFRGGYWLSYPSNLSSARRNYYTSTSRDDIIGFRIFRTGERG